MNIASFSEVTETSIKKFADSPLAKQMGNKEFNKNMSNYDMPLKGIEENQKSGKKSTHEVELPTRETNAEFPENKDHYEDHQSLESIQEQNIERQDDLKNEAQDASVEDVSENDVSEKKGGSYGEVFKEGEGDTHEVHHMPADSASNLERNDGPAIKMEKGDHRETASCGSSKEAREYRDAQRKLIEEGKFREALQMDIDDIHEKFGDKYDDAIAEMLEYVDKLEEEGKING